MSLKETRQVRKNKFFTRWDIAIYLILIFALIFSLILLFVVSSDEKAPDYLEIRSEGTRIAVYQFGSGDLEIEEGKESLFRTEEKDGKSLIYIYTEDGGFNLLTADNAQRTADMTDADCSAGKDCTLMHIRRVGQTIVCVPHGLVIEGKSADGDDGGDIVIG